MPYDAPPSERDSPEEAGPTGRQHSGQIPRLSSGADKRAHVNLPARIARLARVRQGALDRTTISREWIARRRGRRGGPRRDLTRAGGIAGRIPCAALPDSPTAHP